MRVEEELGAYLQVLWRYKWMVGVCAIIASMVALGASMLLTPVYTGTATLRLASSPIGASDYISLSSITRVMNTYVEIASSDIILDEVAGRLGLSEQPEVEIEIVPETELITISASDTDPARASDTANTLAAMMVEQGVQLYGGDAPTAREILADQLAQAKADLDEAVAAYDAALRQTPAPADNGNSGTPTVNAELDTLERLLSIRQQIYGDLLQRYEATRVNEQMRANALTVVEPASPAEKPSSPKMPLNAALGLVAGLAVGVILAFLFEAMDDTLRGIESVQAITTLPVIGVIPERKRSLVAILRRTCAGVGERLPMLGFRHLCARLVLPEVTPKSASLLITSPEPGAGKSAIAANLAIALTDAGHRVVLVDMDFRRPRQHILFGLPNEMGLSDYIDGKIDLDGALQNTYNPSLRVAVAGSSPDQSSDWLAPGEVGAVLGRLGEFSDYVVIDAPAWLGVADPAVIASQADEVIVVVSRRKTERKQFGFMLQQLAELNAKVAGVVLNRMPASRAYAYYPDWGLRAPKLTPMEEIHSLVG